MGRKDIHMKFNHYTINSHHNRLQSTNEILKDDGYREYLLELFNEVKDNPQKSISLLDGIYIKGVVGVDLYAISLEDENGNILLETAGAKEEDGVSLLRCVLADSYQKIFGQKCYIEEKTEPVVYDMILPWSISRIDIMEWTGDFCRSFGAIAFEEMNKKICN